MGLSEGCGLVTDSSPGRCWGKTVSRGSCAEMSTSSGVLGTVRRWVCPGHSTEEEGEAGKVGWSRSPRAWQPPERTLPSFSKSSWKVGRARIDLTLPRGPHPRRANRATAKGVWQGAWSCRGAGVLRLSTSQRRFRSDSWGQAGTAEQVG